MRIEDYFQQIQESIQSCTVVQLTDISYSQRGSYEGFIHHKHDGSEDNVISSPGPDLFQVLKEIESLVKLP